MRAATAENQQLIVLMALSGILLGGAYLLSGAQVGRALTLALGLTAAIIAFLRTEISIHLLILAMLLSPEFEAGATEGATLHRPITLRIDDVMLVIISSAWFIKSVLYKELNILTHTPLNRGVFFYSSACLLSTLVAIMMGAVQPTTGLLFLLKYIEYFLVFWMVVNTTHDEAQVKRYLAVVVSVAVIVSLVAIVQIPAGRRVTAPFEGKVGEPNTLGGYLLFMLSLILGIAISSPKARKSLLAVAAILVVPFLYTLSRSSYLGFVPALLSLPFLTRKRWLSLWFVLGLLVTMLFPAVLPRIVVERIEFTVSQKEQKNQTTILGRRVDTSTSARIEVFSESVKAFLQKPFLGWGVTGWHFVDSQYFRTMVETGLVGLSFFVFLLAAVFRMAWRVRRHFLDGDRFYFGLTCGFLAGFIGLMFHAIGSNTFIIVRIMEPFWLICGLIFLLPQLAAAPAAEPAPAGPASQPT